MTWGAIAAADSARRDHIARLIRILFMDLHEWCGGFDAVTDYRRGVDVFRFRTRHGVMAVEFTGLPCESPRGTIDYIKSNVQRHARGPALFAMARDAVAQGFVR